MDKIKALMCLGLLLAAPALAEKTPSPALQSRFLREDLALAKASSLYFVIQMKTGTMSLRAGGVTLKEWKVAGVRAWGPPHPLEPLTVEKKSTLFPPKRAEIIPTSEEEGEQARAEPAKADKKKDGEKPKVPELEALELKDMPASFMFLMSDSTRVYFRPRARNFFPRIASFGHSLSWYFGVPLKNLWLRLNKRPFSAIDIKLENPEDCQSIYWSLAEGAKGLIFPL
jgi:hypothetical protein